jgi:hypothetical protein
MHGIINFYLQNFFSPKEGLYVSYDEATGYRGDEPGQEAWSDMHKFNDDFNCIAIMNAYNLTADEKYLEYIEVYLDWAATQQHENGSFGLCSSSVSSCVCALNFMNGFILTGKTAYRKVAEKALAHLKENMLFTNDRDTDGGILGLDHCAIAPDNDVICLRVTAYSIYTFILFDIIEKYYNLDKIPGNIITHPLFPCLKPGSKMDK